jgi:hypothetical protein
MTLTDDSSGRYALIVAGSSYRDPKLRQLRAPGADADRLSAVLSDLGIGAFDVQIAHDEEESRLRRRIATFFSNRRPNDLLLVHFSCHGVKNEDGELYLAAADTEMGDLLTATAISSTWLSEQIGRCRSKRVILLLDCCFSGSFPFGMRSRAGEGINVRDHLEGRGRAIITASSAMEYSYEGDQLSGRGEPSIFTEAVVDGLRTGKADCDGDKLISVDDLYNYVYERVKEKTPSQTPNRLSSLEGQVYIAVSSYEPPVQPAKLNDDLIALTKHPIASARAGAAGDLAKLRGDSDPAVALAARRVLERMTDDDSLSVRQAVQAALGEPDPVPAHAPAVAAAAAPLPPRSPAESRRSRASRAVPAMTRTETVKGSRRQLVQLRSVYKNRPVLLSSVLLIGGIVWLVVGLDAFSRNSSGRLTPLGIIFVVIGGLLICGGIGGLAVALVRGTRRILRSMRRGG